MESRNTRHLAYAGHPSVQYSTETQTAGRERRAFKFFICAGLSPGADPGHSDRVMNHTSILLRLAAMCAFMGCTSFLAPTSQAQPSGAYGVNFLYRVMKDDTLIMLSERFTEDGKNWRTLQTL